MNWIKKNFSNPEDYKKAGKWRRYLRDPEYWHLNLHSASHGVAIGLFTACIPLMPFQTLIAIVLSILFRANLPLALAVSWVSNPLTLVPMTYFTYLVGDSILGESNQIVIQQYGWHFNSIGSLWSSFSSWITQFGKAFFVGLPIVAFGAAFIGYFTVIIIWKGVELYKLRKKKK